MLRYRGRHICRSNVKHDLFDVGMALLELGTQFSALRMHEEAIQCPEYGEHSAVAFRGWIVDKESPKLGRVRGKDYQAATALCIKFGFQSDETEVRQSLEGGLGSMWSFNMFLNPESAKYNLDRPPRSYVSNAVLPPSCYALVSSPLVASSYTQG